MSQIGSKLGSFDVVLIGGGIIGLLTARELHSAGLRVCIIERGQLARESSWAGGGILSPLYPWRYDKAVTELAQFSQQIYPALAEQLYHDTGVDPEWTKNGLLIVQSADEQISNWLHRYHPDFEILNQTEIARVEPELSTATEAILLPSIAQIRNPKLADAVKCDLEKRGVTLITETEVERIVLQNDAVTGVATNRGRVEAEQLVVTAGAWTQTLLEPFGLKLPIKPIRGQMLLYQAQPSLIRHVVLRNDRYVIPRRDGLVLVGSTVEDVGFDKSTTHDARNELAEFVHQQFPNLSRAPIVKHWSGLRPSSPGGIPTISRHPSISGLNVAAGHYRNGVVLAPATARLITDLLLNKSSFCDVVPYQWPY